MTTQLPIFGTPNHLDSTFVGSGYNPVVISGGSWLSTRPRSNLISPLFSENTRSTNLSNTFLHCDLGVTRDVNLVAIPKQNNISRTGQIRLRASANAAWTGVTVNGVNALNATSLSVSTTVAINVTAGDGFTIAGDTQVYQATADVSIGAATTGSIGVTRVDDSGTGLALATAGSEAVTCHAGDMSDLILDTGYLDVGEIIYPPYSLYYGHPSVADGKATPEEYAKRKIPFCWANTAGYTIARYWRVDVSDPLNADGYIILPRLFICGGYAPTKGARYGVQIGRFTNSTMVVSKGGAEIPNEQVGGRTFIMGIENIPQDEAFTYILSMLEDADITKQIFLMFDKTATIHKHRLSFPVRMKSLNPLSVPYFEHCDAVFDVSEVIA